MGLFCGCCGRDIDALGQDNMSTVAGSALCEDCAKELAEEAENAKREWMADYKAMVWEGISR